MKVLCACEYSQTVLTAFKLRGHDVYSCDLLPCEGPFPELHIQGDVVPLLRENWDLIIAHPPCTYLSKVQGFRLNKEPGRLEKGYAARDFFMLFYDLPGRVCIENPVPCKCFGLPPYSQVIQPYYFGEPFSKQTCLWLKNLPPLFGSCIVPDHSSFVMQYRDGHRRSRFFPGVADAMALQWGCF